MGKTKEVTPELVDEIIEEPVEVKSPTRDADPEPEYVPAYQVVNDRQNIYTDKIPPKIMSLEALIAAGMVNETNLAEYLEDNGYVKNTDYATGATTGVIIASNSYGLSVTSGGSLVGATRTEAQYNANSGNMIISKGTLENIAYSFVFNALEAIFHEAVSEPDPAKTYSIRFYDTGAGPTIEFVAN